MELLAQNGGYNKYCEEHWPSDVLNTDPHAIFLILLIEDRLVEKKEFINYAIDHKSLDEAYKKFSPVCCYLGNEEMQEIYDQAAFIHHTQINETNYPR